MDFGSKEVVLSFLDIECDAGHNFVSSGLFSGGIYAEWYKQWNYPQGSPCLQLEAREPGGCIHGVHDGKTKVREFG